MKNVLQFLLFQTIQSHHGSAVDYFFINSIIYDGTNVMTAFG